MTPPPVALSPTLPSELLSFILTHQSYPTTLIICQPRPAFLTSVLRCVPHVLPKSHAPAPPPSRHLGHDFVGAVDLDESLDIEQGGGEVEGGQEGGNKQELERHHLLIPALHQIATSRNINLIYTSSVSHLRAHLYVFHTKVEQNQSKTQTFSSSGTRAPLLIIYGLIESHRHTSEWSAQGLGVTLASLVDAGEREGRKVVLIEELDWACERDDHCVRRKEYSRRVWEERIPILNGSVRRVGIESEEGGWSGRTVEVGRVLSRWFRFEKGEWDAE